jgi:hypothetical protein
VAKLTGFPRATVRYWRQIGRPPGSLAPPDLTGWRPADGTRQKYCYLLGLYLGDGCLAASGRHRHRLILTLDHKYPKIIDAACRAIETVCPGVNVCRNERPGCIALCANHPAWPHAFPQDGPGRKHTRTIELEDWQRGLCAAHPRELIRGLIHSDGCRVINRFSIALPTDRIETYQYVRYFFTNYSADIRRIFCEHCALLGIRWTQSSFKNISVSHRDSVAILDEFVGPKA